ncbi:MAG: ATP-binding cassette domain-containing protein [Planctomycetales bacterium]|nr:ATP-binding cassette domain-containing protein [Planctomycetales bacterium]
MIIVNRLTKAFSRGRSQFVAVDGVSFRVAAGEVYGLLGPNGAGKTTTLRMILGLLSPSSGYAEVDGFRSSDDVDQVKARLGFVSAEAGVYPWLTPREVLLYFADVYGIDPTRAKTELERVADLMNLHEFLDQRCTTLSSGQKQRVNLARALIHDPPAMLLDEPTRGLDVVASKTVFDYIETLRSQGKAVLVSTHRLEQAQRLCDRFGLLHRGRLRHEGTLAELQTATGHENLAEMFLDMLSSRHDETQVSR